jgi:hypothetical protein
MAIGYILALMNIYDKTQFTFNGIAEHYRGNEEELIYPMEFGDLISTSHTHLLGMTLMFMMLGTILMFTSVAESVKKWIICLAFTAIFLDIVSIWLIRYVAPQFTLLVMFAGGLMGISFLLLFVIPLRDTFAAGREGKNE